MMQKTLSKNHIIEQLKTDKDFLKQNFGVIKIGLFGSYAKNQQTQNSDIDLLVEFQEPRFDWIANLQAYMEQRFEKKIEIVRKRELSNSKFFDRVEKDVIYA
ncbi:nucleotidyltransferase family protein [Desulfobacter curvatus]|uniref:nucleotidyltransferase family protein n=1 Tax=Desulfobacter curvatus TaxID=2290 RepID=UPI001FE16A95|nr:nucleotidyltransferase domain-containing protein [Desulfobacter curvatus]